MNRRRVVAVELRAGDLLQIGPFAWSFSAVDGQLVPLAPIAGVGLKLADLHVTGRLGPQFNLTIAPGQFVALVGGSGAGKSTLVKVLAGQPGLIAAGRVDVLESDGSRWARAENSERFRDALGYVSQNSILHEALSPHQILTASARLRCELWDAATRDRPAVCWPRSGFKTNPQRERGRFHTGHSDALAHVAGCFSGFETASDAMLNRNC